MIGFLNLIEIYSKYLAEGKSIKLHLGCGFKKFEGYINCDLNKECSDADVLHNCTNFQELPDNSVDEILTYHMIEHVGHRNLVPMFIEWRRILKPGGKIIFETPNLAAIIERFSQMKANSGEIQGDFGDGSIYETLYGGQKDPGSIHISCLTTWQLMVILKAAGFEDQDPKDGHFKIIKEPPQYGKEYGPAWNLRFIVEK